MTKPFEDEDAKAEGYLSILFALLAVQGPTCCTPEECLRRVKRVLAKIEI